MRLFKKGEKFLYVLADTQPVPVFSEEFLYPKMTKDDARFILGVAEEYEKVIEILGEHKVKAILKGEV